MKKLLAGLAMGVCCIGAQATELRDSYDKYLDSLYGIYVTQTSAVGNDLQTQKSLGKLSRGESLSDEDIARIAAMHKKQKLNQARAFNLSVTELMQLNHARDQVLKSIYRTEEVDFLPLQQRQGYDQCVIGVESHAATNDEMLACEKLYRSVKQDIAQLTGLSEEQALLFTNKLVYLETSGRNSNFNKSKGGVNTESSVNDLERIEVLCDDACVSAMGSGGQNAWTLSRINSGRISAGISNYRNFRVRFVSTSTNEALGEERWYSGSPIGTPYYVETLNCTTCGDDDSHVNY